MRKIDRNEYKEYLEFANECIANRVYPISIVTGTQDGDIYTDDKGCTCSGIIAALHISRGM